MSLLLQLLLLGSIGPQEGALPPLNQAIVAHVLTVEGAQVDRGECWDLAAAALNKAGARWDGAYGFGRRVEVSDEAVLPGDIVQFEGVQLEHRTAASIENEQLRPPHGGRLAGGRSGGVGHRPPELRAHRAQGEPIQAAAGG